MIFATVTPIFVYILSLNYHYGHGDGTVTGPDHGHCHSSACENNYETVHHDLTDEELFRRGHMKPFGSHRPPDKIVEELPFMISPQDFYMNYVIKHKPVVIKGAVKRWPAYNLWTDKYLNKTYGNNIFNMETKRDDKWNIPKSMKMSEFLEIYENADRYLVDELLPEMRKEVILPLCLRCEEMNKYFFVSYFWFSQGNTSSQLHIDTDENVLCVVRGRKVVLLVSPEYSQDLYTDTTRVLGVSDINMLAVDMKEYPRVKNVRYIKAVVEEGDMVYIPQMWWHQVYSSPGRQQAVALWWKSKPWSTKQSRRSLRRAEQDKQDTRPDKYSYSNVLAEYEKWVHNVSKTQPMITCNEQKVLMSEYQFETDKVVGADQTLGDGGYLEEDHPDEYKDVHRTDIRDRILICDFDYENMRSPCHYEPCQKDDEDLRCIRYALDYCGDFQDRGCVVQLPQLLNKVDKNNYARIKEMKSDYKH